ncbi:MAG: lysyl-tRNA synthetase, class 2 [Chloroflexi bacterium]|nr:MAG: lysyl-tRNA synthetase, class 2 [Chloroflexota bacterium]
MPEAPSERLQELSAQRREKADALRAAGVDPYPARGGGALTRIAEARSQFEAFESAGSAQAEAPGTRVAGRITNLRNLGKLAFLDVRDGSGAMQLMCRKNVLGDDWSVLAALDLGDFVEAAGSMIRTRTGEISIDASELRMLTKSLRPPPEKFHGLQDVEARYRQRYLDLQSNEDSRGVLVQRSQIIAAVRRFMEARGFLEVETPVLQPEAGGAAARPFLTHLNALDEERYLRIALELHLKRLIVGGLDRVYELGRIFRNEGTSTRHNPEFTMMESYQAYADYGDVARMVEELVSTVAQEVLGTTSVQFGTHTLELAPPWRRVTMREALQEYAGVDFFDYRDVASMTALLHEKHIAVPENAGWGKLLDALVSETVEPRLIQPTFLLDYPVELSPLAKRRTDEPSLVERFEAFAAGWELGNAYSELNDPVDQRARFASQVALQDAGDDEAEMVDEDFLVALEHGMPPTGGLGIGIDRLVMVLTNSESIRDVILFPLLRRRG